MPPKNVGKKRASVNSTASSGSGTKSATLGSRKSVNSMGMNSSINTIGVTRGTSSSSIANVGVRSSPVGRKMPKKRPKILDDGPVDLASSGFPSLDKVEIHRREFQTVVEPDSIDPSTIANSRSITNSFAFTTNSIDAVDMSNLLNKTNSNTPPVVVGTPKTHGFKEESGSRPMSVRSNRSNSIPDGFNPNLLLEGPPSHRSDKNNNRDRSSQQGPVFAERFSTNSLDDTIQKETSSQGLGGNPIGAGNNRGSGSLAAASLAARRAGVPGSFNKKKYQKFQATMKNMRNNLQHRRGIAPDYGSNRSRDLGSIFADDLTAQTEEDHYRYLIKAKPKSPTTVSMNVPKPTPPAPFEPLKMSEVGLRDTPETETVAPRLMLDGKPLGDFVSMKQKIKTQAYLFKDTPLVNHRIKNSTLLNCYVVEQPLTDFLIPKSEMRARSKSPKPKGPGSKNNDSHQNSSDESISEVSEPTASDDSADIDLKVITKDLHKLNRKIQKLNASTIKKTQSHAAHGEYYGVVSGSNHSGMHSPVGIGSPSLLLDYAKKTGVKLESELRKISKGDSVKLLSKSTVNGNVYWGDDNLNFMDTMDIWNGRNIDIRNAIPNGTMNALNANAFSSGPPPKIRFDATGSDATGISQNSIGVSQQLLGGIKLDTTGRNFNLERGDGSVNDLTKNATTLRENDEKEGSPKTEGSEKSFPQKTEEGSEKSDKTSPTAQFVQAIGSVGTTSKGTAFDSKDTVAGGYCGYNKNHFDIINTGFGDQHTSAYHLVKTNSGNWKMTDEPAAQAATLETVPSRGFVVPMPQSGIAAGLSVQDVKVQDTNESPSTSASIIQVSNAMQQTSQDGSVTTIPAVNTASPDRRNGKGARNQGGVQQSIALGVQQFISPSIWSPPQLKMPAQFFGEHLKDTQNQKRNNMTPDNLTNTNMMTSADNLMNSRRKSNPTMLGNLTSMQMQSRSLTPIRMSFSNLNVFKTPSLDANGERPSSTGRSNSPSNARQKDIGERTIQERLDRKHITIGERLINTSPKGLLNTKGLLPNVVGNVGNLGTGNRFFSMVPASNDQEQDGQFPTDGHRQNSPSYREYDKRCHGFVRQSSRPSADKRGSMLLKDGSLRVRGRGGTSTYEGATSTYGGVTSIYANGAGSIYGRDAFSMGSTMGVFGSSYRDNGSAIYIGSADEDILGNGHNQNLPGNESLSGSANNTNILASADILLPDQTIIAEMGTDGVVGHLTKTKIPNDVQKPNAQNKKPDQTVDLMHPYAKDMSEEVNGELLDPIDVLEDYGLVFDNVRNIQQSDTENTKNNGMSPESCMMHSQKGGKSRPTGLLKRLSPSTYDPNLIQQLMNFSIPFEGHVLDKDEIKERPNLSGHEIVERISKKIRAELEDEILGETGWADANEGEENEESVETTAKKNPSKASIPSAKVLAFLSEVETDKKQTDRKPESGAELLQRMSGRQLSPRTVQRISQKTERIIESMKNLSPLVTGGEYTSMDIDVNHFTNLNVETVIRDKQRKDKQERLNAMTKERNKANVLLKRSHEDGHEEDDYAKEDGHVAKDDAEKYDDGYAKDDAEKYDDDHDKVKNNIDNEVDTLKGNEQSYGSKTEEGKGDSAEADFVPSSQSDDATDIMFQSADIRNALESTMAIGNMSQNFKSMAIGNMNDSFSSTEFMSMAIGAGGFQSNMAVGLVNNSQDPGHQTEIARQSMQTNQRMSPQSAEGVTFRLIDSQVSEAHETEDHHRTNKTMNMMNAFRHDMQMEFMKS